MIYLWSITICKPKPNLHPTVKYYYLRLQQYFDKISITATCKLAFALSFLLMLSLITFCYVIFNHIKLMFIRYDYCLYA